MQMISPLSLASLFRILLKGLEKKAFIFLSFFFLFAFPAFACTATVDQTTVTQNTFTSIAVTTSNISIPISTTDKSNINYRADDANNGANGYWATYTSEPWASAYDSYSNWNFDAQLGQVQSSYTQHAVVYFSQPGTFQIFAGYLNGTINQQDNCSATITVVASAETPTPTPTTTPTPTPSSSGCMVTLEPSTITQYTDTNIAVTTSNISIPISTSDRSNINYRVDDINNGANGHWISHTNEPWASAYDSYSNWNFDAQLGQVQSSYTQHAVVEFNQPGTFQIFAGYLNGTINQQDNCAATITVVPPPTQTASSGCSVTINPATFTQNTDTPITISTSNISIPIYATDNSNINYRIDDANNGANGYWAAYTSEPWAIGYDTYSNWDFDARLGLIQTSPYVQHAVAHFTQPGTFKIFAGYLNGALNQQDNCAANATVVAANNPPNINQISNATINEGDTYTASGSFTDPDSTSWTATVDYGDNSGTQSLTLSGTNFSLSHVYKDNGTYTVTVSVTDNQGSTGTGTATVTVNNVNPSVGTITAPTAPVLVNTSFTASANFTDPGVLDTHTASWNWGDGNTTTGTVTETNGSGSVSDSHTYSSTGVYTITLTVTDKDGGQGTSTYQYVAVYDSNTSFAGGRSFDNPSSASPSTSGKITFGISAKYNNSNVLTGSTKMNFKAANIDFASTSLSSLATSNGRAYLQGSGTVNGNSGYTFLATGIDGSVVGGSDKIRFQIKDSSNNVVYDSQPGAGDTADPTTVDATGNIRVH